LEIIGRGAVSPAGCSAEALWMTEPPEPTLEGILSRTVRPVPVRKVDLKQDALMRWGKEPRLRRASPLAYFLAEAAAQALGSAPEIPRERVGLVCALGTGSILYSRKFYADALKQGRRFASPALFPETVYNSPVSHLASVLKLGGACYTLMGDETAWVEALRVAQVWLARGSVEAVLVVGGEELDAISLEAFDAAGWFRRGLVAAEGAGAVLVQKAGPDSIRRLEVSPTSTTFRTRAEQRAAWEAHLGVSKKEIPRVLPATVVPPSLAGIYAAMKRTGPDFGAAFTASAAWNFLQAEHLRKSEGAFQLLVPGANTAVTSVTFG
jgi:hypothetical protein